MKPFRFTIGFTLFLVALFALLIFAHPKPDRDGANYLVIHRHAVQGNDTYRAVDVDYYQGRCIVDLPGGERIELMGDIEVRRISK